MVLAAAVVDEREGLFSLGVEPPLLLLRALLLWGAGLAAASVLTDERRSA
jgi:hypothetical protein